MEDGGSSPSQQRQRVSSPQQPSQDGEKQGSAPVWGLLRGREYSDRQTTTALAIIAAVVVVVGLLPLLGPLLQLGILAVAIVVGLALAERHTDREGIAGWWYEPVRFPWVAWLLVGTVSASRSGSWLFGSKRGVGHP